MSHFRENHDHEPEHPPEPLGPLAALVAVVFIAVVLTGLVVAGFLLTAGAMACLKVISGNP